MGDRKIDRDEEFRSFIVGAWPRLMRTAYLLAGERYAAEDLVQSAAEKACAAWGRVRRADDPYAYVRRILVNQHTRRARRRPPELLVDAGPGRRGRLTDPPPRAGQAGGQGGEVVAVLRPPGRQAPGRRHPAAGVRR